MRKAIIALGLLSVLSFSTAQAASPANPFVVAAADKEKMAMSGKKKKDGSCTGNKQCSGKKAKKMKKGSCTANKCSGSK